MLPDTDYRCPTCGRDGAQLHHCTCPIPDTPARARIEADLRRAMAWQAECEQALAGAQVEVLRHRTAIAELSAA